MPSIAPSRNGHADILPAHQKVSAPAAGSVKGLRPGLALKQRDFSSVGRVGRVGRAFTGGSGLAAKVGRYLTDYVVMKQESAAVSAAWVLASHSYETWDRHAHLAITSVEKRCGKTRTLQVLTPILPKPLATSNISPAAVYRLIDSRKPTLLLDEAQCLTRRGNESTEALREIFCAGIDRNSVVYRCGGKTMEDVLEFPIYCPKVLALIGELDGVLADRCLPIKLERKTAAEIVLPYRSREVEQRGKALLAEIEQWATDSKEQIAATYADIEPFPIANDRMAELLMPLQTVLSVLGDDETLEMLMSYIAVLDKQDQENNSPGVLLLAACKEIFATHAQGGFITTQTLIEELVKRELEPWHRWNDGDPINPEKLAKLLKPYTIKPSKKSQRVKFGGKEHITSLRGYYTKPFTKVWERYLPPPSP